MTEQYTKSLCEKYPIIFGNNFYFECGDGWYNLIDNLCKMISNHDEWINYKIDLEKKNGITSEDYEHVNVEAAQVKEKFGGLRFYVLGGDEYVRGLIDMAEKMSYSICEVCGHKGEERDTSWIRTLCDIHYTESTKKKLSSDNDLTIDMFDVTVAP